MPVNYSFTRYNPFLIGNLTPAVPLSPAGIFDPVAVTNQCTAFGALFSPTTVSLSSLPTANQYVTNLPGRMEINADANLDLTFARISGLNYLRLKSTNHVVSTAGARIVSPTSDLYLGTTNGYLTITNLLSPVVQRFTGTVDLWSGRWTNDFGGFHTRYSVLMVDSRLEATAPAVVENLSLRSTNVVINDIMNVTKSLLIDAQNVTIATNQQPSPTKSGELNLSSPDITWSSSTPRLQNFTNNGVIKSLNAVYLGGIRTTPYYSNNFSEPYLSLVNRGSLTTQGSLIWAKYFENVGLMNTGIGFGSISIQSENARLTNGSITAINADVTITTGNLISTNHSIQAGRELILTITNLLTDTGASNANNWVVGKGFSLPIKPANGNLTGTVITETAGATENLHTWAAENRGGTNSAGFLTNSAIGKVVLNGTSPDSLFTFTGATSNNAIYIDYLDLRNYATNIDLFGNATALNINPNITVYYAQAVAGSISVAERLNHANGGRLQWVATHAGIYSTTNVVYPDGSTNAFNVALVQSENLDSDNDGLVNAADPTPLVANLALAVAITSQPALGAKISWRTVPDSANTVYYKTSPSSAAWLELTNFNIGELSTERVSIFDPMSVGGSRVYRVKMTPPQP